MSLLSLLITFVIMIKFNDIILRDDCNVFNAYYDQPSLSCYADPHGANHRPSFDHVELLDYDIILQISDIDIHIFLHSLFISTHFVKTSF